MLLGIAASAILCGLYAHGGWAWLLGFAALVPWLITLDRSHSLGKTLLSAYLMSVAYTLSVFAWFGTAIGAYTQVGQGLGLWRSCWRTCLPTANSGTRPVSPLDSTPSWPRLTGLGRHRSLGGRRASGTQAAGRHSGLRALPFGVDAPGGRADRSSGSDHLAAAEQ